MPTQCSAEPLLFPPVEGRAVAAAFDGGVITCDAGALLLGATDRAIGLVARLARCFTDRRLREAVEHDVETLVMQRVFGLALGYEDLNDHDALRHDPMMAVLAGKLSARRADCAPVAGKSTLNRLERSLVSPTRYHNIAHDSATIEALSVDGGDPEPQFATGSNIKAGRARSDSDRLAVYRIPVAQQQFGWHGHGGG